MDYLKYYGTPSDKDYLKRYPDVSAAVQKGQFVSGFHHFKEYGEKENRTYDLTLNKKAAIKVFIVAGLAAVILFFIFRKKLS